MQQWTNLMIFCTSLLAEIALSIRQVRWWLNYAQCFLKFECCSFFSVCSLVIYSIVTAGNVSVSVMSHFVNVENCVVCLIPVFLISQFSSFCFTVISTLRYNKHVTVTLCIFLFVMRWVLPVILRALCVCLFLWSYQNLCCSWPPFGDII